MNKMKKTSVLLLLLSSIFMPTLLLTQSCENDDLFNLDEGDTPQPVMMTRAGIDMSEYLDMSSSDSRLWSEQDIIVFEKAIGRIGVVYNEQTK